MIVSTSTGVGFQRAAITPSDDRFHGGAVGITAVQDGKLTSDPVKS
jgi:hypothetical protein